MGKVRNNQSGFGALEIVVVLVIIGIIGVMGFMVYKNQNQANPAKSVATSTIKPATASHTKTATPSAKTTPFVNVIQEDSSITQVTLDKIAKTADEASILTALHNACNGTDTYVTVNHVVFDGTPNFVQSGNYADINATACSPIAKTLDDLGGSGSANYLHKNSSGTWILDTSSQMTPSCAKIDGLGYPTSIISTCSDGSTARTPR
jgi:hypothetical protein